MMMILDVPFHMITVGAGDFQSDWRKCDPIKTQRSTGTVKSAAPYQRYFLAASAYGRR